MWLTDDLHHTIRQFSPEGALLLTIGNPDQPSTLHGGKPFHRPTHVALCPRTGNVYISDGYGNSHVHKYDPAGRHLLSWAGPAPIQAGSTFPTTFPPNARAPCTFPDAGTARCQLS